MKKDLIKEAVDKIERKRKQAGNGRKSSIPEAPGEAQPADDVRKFPEISGESLGSVVGGSRPGDPRPPQ